VNGRVIEPAFSSSLPANVIFVPPVTASIHKKLTPLPGVVLAA